ncbi:sulfurtransferase [Sphingomonas morindae]|uniref:Sulfurtransferase n=1 Tax=Sphingomonas morindae TaxID=1541170 RepID=A0ABY4XCQ8_9SPHN|nr:sulfurtransferase [Sphingomonas morindae]USI74450.1 sulfurtransferase [Sphingomonas morindae]
MDDLVSIEWLTREAPADLVILDATYLPFEPERDAAAEYRAGHIAGARFLDLASLVDPASSLPATVPPLATFRARMAALGVRRTAPILLYDDSPHHTSARAWWLLRLYGATRVALLDGGLAAWRAAGRPLATGASPDRAISPDETDFTARDAALLVSLEAMRAAQAAGDRPIVDARGRPRFSGAEADPRPGVAPGHMPGAVNLPYGQLFAADGRWHAPEALAAAFAAAGVDPRAPAIFTCGSGITAAGLMFAAHLLGGGAGQALYDGSWSEWGSLADTPKQVDAA